jgi:hypothetical protein
VCPPIRRVQDRGADRQGAARDRRPEAHHLKPFAEKKGEKIGLYYLGRWPFEGGSTPRSRAYANPSGFIEVTRENKGTPVSEHFKLGDFLTKDQYDVWPKYLVLEPRLLDKLELVIQELQSRGTR